MLCVKVKDKKDLYDIKIKGKNCDLFQGIAILDTLFRYFKEEFGLSTKDILYMLVDFKQNTKEGD